MVQYKKQLDAVMRCLTAETEEDRKNAQQEIRELLDGAERTAGKQDAETLVRDILVDIGVPEHLVGHPYLVAAICAAVEDGTCLKKITSDLYHMVATTYGTTPSRVERSIRHAIEVAWDRCDPDVMQHYFGNTVSSAKGKTTNSEFIARVANVVRMRMK